MKIMTCKETLIEKIVNIIQEAELDNSTAYETLIYLHVLPDDTASVAAYLSVGDSELRGDGMYCIGTVKGAYETLGEIWTDSPEQLCDMLDLDIDKVIRNMVEVQGFEKDDITETDIYKYLDKWYGDIIREEVEDRMNWMYRSEYWTRAEGMLDEWAEGRDVEWMTTTDREEV